jgi:seryl-tRNA synthetase
MKLELVKIINPKDNDKEFKHLVESARIILEELELPHRIINLCTGDIGNSANMTYDIEV